MDFNIHDIAGIRLLDAAPGDVQMVARQLGSFQGAFSGTPDLTVRFVERLEMNAPLRYTVLGRSGYTDDLYVVVQDRKTVIPFDRIGAGGELICERGGSSIPLLLPIINLIALSKGVLPLHASAFRFCDTGVMFAGFPQGGKTTALLAFMAHDAQYIADDWVYVRDDQMVGLPTAITLRDWQLDDLPEYRTLIPRRDKLRLRSIRRLQAFERRLPSRVRKGSPPGRLFNKAVRVLSKRLTVELKPDRLFAGHRMQRTPTRLDTVFLILAHDSPDIEVTPLRADDLVHRLALLQQHEWHELVAQYEDFRFAFPAKTNPILERRLDTQRALLEQMGRAKPAFVVYHPHPVALDRLYHAIVPYISAQ